MLPDSNMVPGCQAHVEAQSYVEAIKSANVSLTGSRATYVPSQRFDVLVCRATAHAGQANNIDAERDFREALQLAARNFDPFDPRLIDPLTRLGQLRLAAEDAGEAELFLLRARDITHRTAGIYNVDQDHVLDHLTDVFMQQGRQQQANKQQELRLRAARETYGNSPELVKALHNYAIWNASIQRFPKVRVTLEEAISILESEHGINDPKLIDTLKLRARLYKQHPTISTPKAGEQAMQRVVDIYSSQEYVDQVDLLKARTNMGDWYLQGLKRNKAMRYYKKTVKQALAENVDEELVDGIYGAPKLVFFDSTRVNFYGRNEAGELLESGKIRVGYNVAANGKTRNVRVLEDTLHNPAVTEEVLGRVQTAVFRPRFVNGKATATQNVEQLFDIHQTGSGLTIGQIYAPIYVKE